MATKTKNRESSWEQIFEKYHILDEVEKNGIYEISSDAIKEFWEPRLMTKYDHYEQLPKIFRENHLSILPNRNGSYLIGPFSTHHEIDYGDIPLRKINHRSDLQSLKPDNLFSEAVSLNYALATGMIKDLVGEVCELTVSGRMKSSDFKFNISNPISGDDREIQVHNAQIEIDGGYESKSKLILVEAKKGKCDDFIIRQLYYPYRLRKEKVSKEVVPVFMTESNGVFSFFIFKFEDENNYNSIKLVKQVNYIVDFKPITEKDVNSLLKNTKTIKEPEVPFPQANDFEKCINLLEFLENGEKTKEEIAIEYSFDERQSDYYKNADRYLGLVENSGKGVMKLTKLGKEIVKLPRKDRNLRLIELIFSHKIFKEIYHKFTKEKAVKKEDVVRIMKESNLYKVNSNKTYNRRASTITGWCKWIKKTINEVK